MTDKLDATIVITTKDRREDLRRALRSCLAQAGGAEVLVVDDGSSDETSEMVRAQFPSVRVERSEHSKGYIAQRNRGASLARGRIVFSIDDDAEFSSASIVSRTLEEFDDARVGAIAIPFINVLQDNIVRQRCPGGQGRYATSSYIGTAHAVRRDLFLRLGGYRQQLFHQGEEGDLCLRMLEAGFVVRLGSADPIHHYESPRRDRRRMDLYGGRNRILFVWHNLPARNVAPAWGRALASRVRWGLRNRRLIRSMEGAFMGFAAVPSEWRERNPVSRQVFRLYRELERKAAVPMDEIRSRLPDPAGHHYVAQLALS